jgi:hypothetical protein
MWIETSVLLLPLLRDEPAVFDPVGETHAHLQLKTSHFPSAAVREFVLGQRYRGVQGKVVHWVEHRFEEGVLHIHVRFTDKTELSRRIAARMTIEESDLADWTSGDFKRLRVFVRNERDTISKIDHDIAGRLGATYQHVPVGWLV